MRYQRLQDIVRLAVRFQGALGGLTLGDIEDEFGVSRRTAERLRDAGCLGLPVPPDPVH